MKFSTIKMISRILLIITIIGFVACALLVSCTSSKHVDKSSKSTDSTVHIKTAEDIHVVDKTVTETETIKQADTSFTVAEDSLSGSFMQDTSIQEFKSATINLRVKFNPKTKRSDFNIISSPKPVAVKFNETTKAIQANNIVTDSKFKEDLKAEGKDKEEIKHKESTTTFGLPWYVWIILVVVFLIVIVFYIAYRKWKKTIII